MWLLIGYGALIGAGVGLLVSLLWCAFILWRFYRIGHMPKGFEITRAYAQEVFWLHGIQDTWSNNPKRFAVLVLGPPLGVCAVLGFIIENIMRLF